MSCSICNASQHRLKLILRIVVHILHNNTTDIILTENITRLSLGTDLKHIFIQP